MRENLQGRSRKRKSHENNKKERLSPTSQLSILAVAAAFAALAAFGAKEGLTDVAGTETDSEAPGTGSTGLVTDSEATELDSEAPETGSEGLETDSEAPETGSEGLETDSAASKTGSEGLETDSEAPETGSEGLETDSTAPDTGSCQMIMNASGCSRQRAERIRRMLWKLEVGTVCQAEPLEEAEDRSIRITDEEGAVYELGIDKAGDLYFVRDVAGDKYLLAVYE